MESIDARVRLLEMLTEGELSLRHLAGLSRRDVAAMSHLAAVAFKSKKFDQAAQIFAGLEALEPDVPVHALRRAHAEAEGGKPAAAIASVTRYIEREDPRPPEELVEALLLRAVLIKTSDPRAASLDLVAAEILGGGSPAAKKLLEGVVK